MENIYDYNVNMEDITVPTTTAREKALFFKSDGMGMDSLEYLGLFMLDSEHDNIHVKDLIAYSLKDFDNYEVAKSVLNDEYEDITEIIHAMITSSVGEEEISLITLDNDISNYDVIRELCAMVIEEEEGVEEYGS